MTEPPIWLDDARDIRALLGAVVDRFDAQSGDTRARNIVLTVERWLPELARNDSEADQTWALVGELATLGVLAIQPGRRNPYDSPWTGAKLKFAPASEGVLRAWLSRPTAPLATERWRAAVACFADAFADRGAALMLRRFAIRGRTEEEIVGALATLRAFDRPATLRQLSALAFWGDSKVLDDRGELIAACFPDLTVRDRRIVVAAHLPEVVEGVLFIENQDTYTLALEGSPAQAANHALVYMSGFRSAANRIRTREGAALHFSGGGSRSPSAVEQFQAWWFLERSSDWPLYFWGDLDFAGMQILKALRARFAAVAAWQAGYAPMLRELAAFGSAWDSAASGQIDPIVTGCTYADDTLLPAIRALGFCDQERLAAR